MSLRRRASALAAAFVLTTAAQAGAQVPLGSEFRVDTSGSVQYFTFASPRESAMAPNGDFVVAWTTANAGAIDVMARRVDRAGVPQGADFRVNSYTTGRQYNQSVGIDDAGNFVVAWSSEGQDGSYEGVFGQRFDASGARLGVEFMVNTRTFDSQSRPSIGVAPSGDFVVVWSGLGPSAKIDIMGQRYDSTGARVGGEFLVNASTSGNEATPSLAMDGGGDFVVIWSHATYYLGPPRTFGRRFTASGIPQGSDFPISSTNAIALTPRIARSRNGSFVVAWSEGDIFARRFDAIGNALGPNFQVNVQPVGAPAIPEVAADADGDFVVVWRGVIGRRFDASGVGGPEFLVTTQSPQHATVACDPAGNFIVAWLRYQNPTNTEYARRYAGGLSPAGLAIDGSFGPTSDGNGVLEPGEAVTVGPSWLNANFSAQTFTGIATTFTGPGPSGNPAYTVVDGAASYGTVASNATGNCASTSDCYTLGVTVPATRPAAHWDAAFHEDIAPLNLGAAKTWTLHVGDSFTDVPRASGFYRFVETLLHKSVTGGCTPSTYCPASSATREQMAVFVLVAKEGPGYAPPACATPMFADVAASSPFCPWIEELARRGVVNGCGGGNYCPTAPVSREQMAVFTLLTKEPGVTPPACVAPVFNDVPASSPYCRWIEELARRGVVTGCGGGNYCPTAAVTREQMAVFLTASFGLVLYGP